MGFYRSEISFVPIRFLPFIFLFEWNTYDIDGHNHLEIKKAFIKAKKFIGKPSVIICNTIKGKGIKDFEGKLISHYRPPSKEQLNDILSKS